MKRKSLAFRIVFIALAVLMVGALVLVALAPLWMHKDERVTASATTVNTQISFRVLNSYIGSVSFTGAGGVVYEWSYPTSLSTSKSNYQSVEIDNNTIYTVTVSGFPPGFSLGYVVCDNPYVNIVYNSGESTFTFQLLDNHVPDQFEIGLVTNLPYNDIYPLRVNATELSEGVESVSVTDALMPRTINPGLACVLFVRVGTGYTCTVNLSDYYTLSTVSISPSIVTATDVDTSANTFVLTQTSRQMMTSSTLTITTGEPHKLASGYYQYKYEPLLPSDTFEVNFPFTSNEQQYLGGMRVSSSQIEYIMQNSDGTNKNYQIVYTASNGWNDVMYSNFYVSGEEAVSNTFFDWFSNNSIEDGSDVNSFLQGAYDKGYGAGQDSGAGYQNGYNSGYNAGYIDGSSVSYSNLSAVSLFLSPVASFLATPLFGSFSIGSAFSVVLVVLLGAIFIKMFAGG